MSLPESYRRGNTTKGNLRRGYSGGRKRLYPLGTELFPLLLKVSDPEYAIAITLGHGKASQGVRRALAIALATLPSGTPQTRAAAYLRAMEERKQKSSFERMKRKVTQKLNEEAALRARRQAANAIAAMRAESNGVDNGDNAWDDVP